jgi:CAAX prenyl protease-like protein
MRDYLEVRQMNLLLIQDFLRKQLGSPIRARVVPFFIFLGLTFCQGQFGEASRYWFYLIKTIVGIWLIWEMWPRVTEMRWAVSLEAVVAGVAVCALWVVLNDFYPKMGKPGAPWNPHAQFGTNSALAWQFVLTRIIGSTLIVPPLEEAFYRSFLYRYFVKTDFQSMPLGRMHWLSFFVTSAIFGLAHYEWLAGILCGLIFQWLVIRKNRLGDAMTAHAITNFLLGIWIVWKGQWQFW